jgi:hypothetical protein
MWECGGQEGTGGGRFSPVFRFPVPILQPLHIRQLAYLRCHKVPILTES